MYLFYKCFATLQIAWPFLRARYVAKYYQAGLANLSTRRGQFDAMDRIAHLFKSNI
jgi:hypothetical protein